MLLYFSIATLSNAADQQPVDTEIAPAQNNNTWRLACTAPKANTKRLCQLRAGILTAENQTIARISIGQNTSGKRAVWYMTTIVPLGAHIPSGIGYRVDKASPVILQFQSCNPEGCRATTRLSSAQVGQLKRGGEMKLIFSDATSRKGIGLTFSLSGITKAIAALLDLVQ